MWQQPDPYLNFPAAIRKKMKQDGQVNEKILAAFSEVFEQTIKDSQVVIARPERQRLFKLLLQDILTELITENK